MKELFKKRDENRARIEELKIGISQLQKVMDTKSDLPEKVKKAREKLDESYCLFGQAKIKESELEDKI